MTNAVRRICLDKKKPEVKVSKMSTGDCSRDLKENEGGRVDALLSTRRLAGRIPWKGFIAALLVGGWILSATEVGLRAIKPPEIICWAFVKTSGVQLRRKHKESSRPLLKLGRGAVLPVFRIHSKNGPRWFSAVGVKLKEATPIRGWVSEDQVELLGRDAVPGDASVLAQMGRPFSDDRISASAQVAEYSGRPRVPGRPWSSRLRHPGFLRQCPECLKTWGEDTCRRPRCTSSHRRTFPPTGARESNSWKCSTW